MTLDEIREMAKMIPKGDSTLISNIVRVLCTLRAMNVEEIDRLLMIHKIAINTVPPETHVAFNAMVSDLVLIKVFIEQAKEFDRTNEGMEAFEDVFGKLE